MAFSWNIPALANKIAMDIPALKGLLTALAKWTDTGTEDVPVDAKRLNEVTGGVRIEKFSGTSWDNVGKLMHDVDMLDGKHATSATTKDTIPIRDANGKLAGDITGNANTATTASSLASGYVVPVTNGGTGAADEANARINLGTNNAANITEGVLAIERGGTGSSTKNFVDLSTNQTIGGNKTFSGEVTLNRNVLKMTVLDTTEGATDTRTDTILQGISSNSDYGITALFGASGNAVIGAGEGKGNLLAELAGNTGEDVYIIADGAIHFHPNANTYANRKSILLNASGELSGLAKVTSTSFVGALTGNVTGNCSGSSGSCTGNAATSSSCSGNSATATKATQDSAGQQINTTYIKALSVSGKTITYTKGDGTTGTITTQDTNTTYANFVKSGSGAKNGLVPAPSTTAGTTKYLREDCSWQVPPNTVYTHPTTAGNKHIPSGGSSGQILRWKASGEAQWGSDNNTTYSAATQSANGLMSAADKKKLDGLKAQGTSIGTQEVAGLSTYHNYNTATKTVTAINHSLVLVYGNKGVASGYEGPVNEANSGCVKLCGGGQWGLYFATSATVKIKVSGRGDKSGVTWTFYQL